MGGPLLGKSVLSARLMMLADMAAPGNRLVDVGCDHGFLSIYLVGAGVCPRALAMDVRRGPLAGAGRHIEEQGLSEYIETRLSDGLAAYIPGEADTLVCAGMGGRLMERILTEGMDKARQMRELILQPQSELREFRAFLRGAGFSVVREEAVREDGKFYFAMKAVPGAPADAGEMPGGEEAGPDAAEKADASLGQGGAERAGAPSRPGGSSGVSVPDMPDRTAVEKKGIKRTRELYDAYGEKLLTGRHPVLLEYLLQRQNHLKTLCARLAAADSTRGRLRMEEIALELEEVEEALAYFG